MNGVASQREIVVMELDDLNNPYRAPEVVFVDRTDGKNYVWVRVTIGLQILVSVIGLVVAFIDVESIVFTGPVLTLIGFLCLLASLRCGYELGGWIGASGPIFCLLIFLTIYLQHWSPVDAQKPVPLISTLYVVALLVAGLYALRDVVVRDRASAATAVQKS